MLTVETHHCVAMYVVHTSEVKQIVMIGSEAVSSAVQVKEPSQDESSQPINMSFKELHDPQVGLPT